MSADFEHGDLRKSIGCMNGIVHLFDRHCFTRSHSLRMIMLQVQDGKEQLEPPSAAKLDMGKDDQSQKKKPRVTTDSYSSALKHVSAPKDIKHSDEERKCSVMKTKASCFEGPMPEVTLRSRFYDDDMELQQKSSNELKELPRPSLDNRGTSIIAKIMGLDEDFSRYETTSPKPNMSRNEAPISKRCSGDGDNKTASCSMRQQGSVYGEIEKRLSELEFNKSGKNLRALKQILEAMHKTNNLSAGKRASSVSNSTRKPSQSTSVMAMKQARLKDQVVSSPKHHSTHSSENPKAQQSLLQRTKRDNEVSGKKLTGKVHQHSDYATTKSPNNGYIKADHRYINKILLTSGILENLTSSQILPSGHLIHPEIFNYLEQREEILETGSNRIKRRMLFDLVDEILVRKMSSDTMGKKGTTLDCLMKEIYREIENLCRIHNYSVEEPKEDRMIIKGDTIQIHQLQEWGEIGRGIPALAVEIERLIFKDLVNEVAKDSLSGF